MSNPQDNPGTPPPPSPSGSSTPPPPSTNPQPKKKCVKMLARKIVATGALLKRLNAQLKASQAQESKHLDYSFKSASEGEGPASFDSEKIQSSTSEVRSVLVESVKNRFVLVGTVRDVEMPELRRRGDKNKNEREKKREGASSDVRGTGVDMVDSSPTSEMIRPAICGAEVEIVGESGKNTGGSGSGEVVEDLLRKVDASYNPKKRRTPTPKIPSTTKNTKKRKANSLTIAEIPLPKGRDTRSMIKQSESELQKPLVKSKKKRIDKGKAKVAETSKVIYVEEMEQVHQEEHTTVEVQTSKTKKTKTSSKKSSSGSKAAESSLAKRTRSAMKNKPVRITEDEEWSGE
uniref:Uncharacterized protein n=1 Tax=Nicotiana tabacum TaxID=4097 RepID=A0A1S4DGS1_TOBAC|nr:PREDICTED: uncharacterized protein LOC107829512 [Nicotiana tabacum]